MQSLDSTDNLLLNQPPTNGLNGDFTGFSHGAFNSNIYSTLGLRDKQSSNMPAINTSRGNETPQHKSDMQTPATAYDMNFTPLLPSQLLMGSPFQPGSPSTFASPQFPGFGSFSSQTPVSATHPQHSHIFSHMQNQQSIGPPIFSVAPSAVLGPPQYYGGAGPVPGAYMAYGNGYGPAPNMAMNIPGQTTRVIYLGNIPSDTSVEEILNHVRSGQIESVRYLNDRNCAFISFYDGNSALHFHSDALLKKLTIRGQEIKVGWGKPSPVPPVVASAVQQSGASRNVYLGGLPSEISEEELREDLGRFGPIDTVKMIREKSIAFVHFLTISSAVKAVNQLPQEQKWQPPRKVFYGKDRCAYISKTQQQNAAQFLGISPEYAHVLNSADRDLFASAMAQQSVAAAAVATAAGGTNNMGNRTVYLGNIHPETSTEEICNVVRGGLLHHIRYIPDKHICFVTFIDPTSAASFYQMSTMQGLMIHNRRLKIGWGKHSGPLPPAIALAVSAGASRNVYVGNIDETWTEDRLRQDFAEYGETELVNMLREKSCAFVNFTNIANAIKAIEAVKGREEYKRFKVNFGKDRCGNPPRQVHPNHQEQYSQQGSAGFQDGLISPGANGMMQFRRDSQITNNTSPVKTTGNSRYPHGHVAPIQSQYLNGNNSSFAMYLSQGPNSQHTYLSAQPPQHQSNGIPSSSNAFYGANSNLNGASAYGRNGNLEVPQQEYQQYAAHGSSNSITGPISAGFNAVGGFLAPNDFGAAVRAQHSRAISLPAFSQAPFNMQQPAQTQQHQFQQPFKNVAFSGLGAGLGLGAGSGLNGFGLAIHNGDGALSRWAEEDVAA